MSRVTSVELDEDDVEYVEMLMRNGIIRSLKEFVEKCVKFGRRYTLDRWYTGLFYIGPLRVTIMPKKAVDYLIERVPEDEHEDVGREIGELAKSFAIFLHHVDAAKNWDLALQLMSDFGLGQFSMTDKNSIQVVSPALPHNMMKSCIETVLETKLEAVQMKIDVQFFKVLKT